MKTSSNSIKSTSSLSNEFKVSWKVWFDIINKSSFFVSIILFVWKQFASKNIKLNITHYSRIKMSKILKITCEHDNKCWCFLCESQITKRDNDKVKREKCSNIDSSKINNKHNEHSIMQCKQKSSISQKIIEMHNSMTYSISRKISILTHVKIHRWMYWNDCVWNFALHCWIIKSTNINTKTR